MKTAAASISTGKTLRSSAAMFAPAAYFTANVARMALTARAEIPAGAFDDRLLNLSDSFVREQNSNDAVSFDPPGEKFTTNGSIISSNLEDWDPAGIAAARVNLNYYICFVPCGAVCGIWVKEPLCAKPPV